MSRSRRDHPNSLYSEVGSSYNRSDYGYGYDNNSTVSGYSSTSRRNTTSSNHHSHGDYPRSRDHRHRDRNERRPRDARSANPRRGRSHSHECSREEDGSSSRKPNSRARSASNNNSYSNRSNSNSNKTIKQHTRGIWEKFVPPDYRPSRADPDARRERLSKEHESEGFDWTPGFVLALMGAATLFSVEKSLIKRQKKDYIHH
ncbi:hypothetical protein V8C34DRAFT_126537 [Trichoderma compactum]